MGNNGDNTRTAIRLRDVSVTTTGLRRLRLGPAPGTDDHPVLIDVSLEVAAGDAVSILGESGGGKSTLLRVVNRMIEVDAGTVEVDGCALPLWSVQQLRRTALYVPQRAFLFGGTVADELYRPLGWLRRAASPRPTPTDIAAADTALAMMELADIGRARPADELSEGQRTRLCLARALLLEPPILLLDEPTGSLDPRTARALLGKLRTWAAERGATLICVTHRPEDVGILGGRAVILLGGRIVGIYPAAAITARDHAVLSDEVRRFLGGIAEERE